MLYGEMCSFLTENALDGQALLEPARRAYNALQGCLTESAQGPRKKEEGDEKGTRKATEGKLEGERRVSLMDE